MRNPPSCGTASVAFFSNRLSSGKAGKTRRPRAPLMMLW